MKHSEFAIGTEFWCGPGQWRCTDIGQRTILAIRLDCNVLERIEGGVSEPRALYRAEAEALGLFNGPPYAVLETVFDEDDFEDCSLEPDADEPEPAATRDERRANLAASIIDRPITEDDEGAWEWCSLWPDSTGLPFKIWLCDIAPVVILGEKFPPRSAINQLYRWMRLNDEVLETLGLYSTMEMIKRLKKL
jgi:hypothetical protein